MAGMSTSPQKWRLLVREGSWQLPCRPPESSSCLLYIRVALTDRPGGETSLGYDALPGPAGCAALGRVGPGLQSRDAGRSPVKDGPEEGGNH